MRWDKEDLEKFITAKEYVDTLLMPLLPFQLSENENIGKMAFQCEVLNIFIAELEKELTGRVLLTPQYYYNKQASKHAEVSRVNTWIDDALTQPFEHVFFITFDATWKKEERDLNGSLIWLPSNHSVDINSKEMVMIIRDQVAEVGELIRSYW